MNNPLCEVAGAIMELADTIDSGFLKVPRCRQLAEELLESDRALSKKLNAAIQRSE